MNTEVSEAKIISKITAKAIAINELEEANNLLNKFINSELCIRRIYEIAVCIAKAFKSGNKVIACGNGGSHCDAMHFAEELSGKFRESRKSYPAIAISDPSYISCVANDFGFSEVFSRFVDATGVRGDVLLAITTSGNSLNVLKAIKKAREKSMGVVLLTGNDGGSAIDIANISIVVPHVGYADRIQEMHIKIIHITILLIEKIMKSTNRVDEYDNDINKLN